MAIQKQIKNICKPPKHVRYTQIKTIATARKVYGIGVRYKPEVNMWLPDMHENKTAEFDVQTVVNAINGKWAPDWKNREQRKYYIWWWVDEVAEGGVSGRGLSLSAVDYVLTHADVAPRLVFETREKALHFVKYFKPLMEKYYFK